MNRLNISFEFFPPKSVEAKQKLSETAATLSQLGPEFFSVTFGAGGSTRDGTIHAIEMLQLKTPVATAPHISCVGSSAADIISLLDHYKTLGVKRLIALRGDMPSGMGQAGELRFASDLVTLIRKASDDHFHIEVAAYPEFHPQAQSAHEDLLNLKRKMDAGANSAITQYFYNPDAYFYYLDHCAKLGIFIPIVPGIMPITQFHNLIRFSDVCGAEIPRWIRKRLESYGDDAESIKAFGFEVVYNLCQRLISGGAPGLHFYTLNQADTCANLVNLLNPAVKQREFNHSVFNDNSLRDG